ncbi:NHL repeat-containing protein [Mycolicibacterium fortuitum]|uniref:Serine/threonine-protein kinase n=4 Tax=Actinomycetes TaxID=1760 RepID=A0AAE4VJZ1_MYCFO|nr:hypothetical protein [Mycolicibacterium fortuitum]MCA4756219.1 hypothetical protein [Mycolicibacterium fortuitum]MCV7143229.1 hypothetical protein [Mycolicibacterium fortuitum]MDG5770995.1 hypothetical protein [Mycolicibacterium fortuitum]MDV7193621.1 hypothetical protein [Mycolicibacterium fortuitum]MDV7208359.1 hypothetical protein [Mycolicibacterium fortuitum]
MGMEKMKLRPRKGFVFTVAAAVVISVLAACSPGSAPTAPSKDVPLQSGEQTTLPFRGFDYREMGVDAKNVLYLGGTGGFATLPSGADQPAPMRPSGNPLVSTFGVAPDGRLSFVALGGAVETIAPGSTTPEPLPFDKLTKFGQMAVGTDGSVYITDNQRNKLLKLAPGAAAPIELPVEIGNGLGHLVVDADDNLYSARDGKILKIAKDAEEAVAIADAPENVGGLAVDAAGNLYATDRMAGTVSRMPGGGGDWVQLPFSGLQRPSAIAVDGDGNVYVMNVNLRETDPRDTLVRLAAK